MKGQCKLYDTIEDLRESHIFPKFVINYTKKTGSKYLRNFSQPNTRLQDGPKSYLLSEKAEQNFSIKEKWFSENIFTPYIENNITSFNYDENLFYFTTSLLWRALLVNLESPKVLALPYLNKLFEVANEWKLFLRDYSYPINYNRFYLFFTDRVKNHNYDISGVDYYLTRALDATIVSNSDNTFIAVYAKFTRFIFWGIIRGGDEKQLKDLRIDAISGELNIPQRLTENNLTSFFMNRIKEIESLPKPSEKQQENILKEILKDKEGFLKSDAGQSITNDHINLNPKN